MRSRSSEFGCKFSTTRTKMALFNARIFSRVSRYRCVLSMASRACLSTTQSEDLLINKERYSFIKELGLQDHNDGVFSGTWGANGEVKVEF